MDVRYKGEQINVVKDLMRVLLFRIFIYGLSTGDPGNKKNQDSV